MTPGQDTQGRGRYHRRFGVIALLLLVSLVLGGCSAHESAYKRSTKLAKNKQYDRAIEQLEEAIALAEKGKKQKIVIKYKQELDTIKREASLYYYEQAEERFTQADLGRAQTLIQRCVTYCPDEQLYQAFNQRVAEAIAEAEQMRTEALALAQDKQWKEATARMEEALRIYRTMPGGEGDLKHIQDRAYQYYLDRAEESLRHNDLPTAETEAQTALSYREKGSEAQAVLNTVKGRREATALIAQGQVLLDGGDYAEALRVLDRALELHPSHPDLPGLLARARQGVCEAWIAEGRQAMAAGQYVHALTLFRKSRDLLPSYGDVSGLARNAESELVKMHMTSSRRDLDNGLSGCAVVHAVAALGYDSSNSDARAQLAQAAAQVRQAVHYTVAFAGIRPLPNNQGIANQLEVATLEHLERTKPENVTVIESPGLRAAFAQMGFTDFNGNGTTPDPFLRNVRAEGIDAVVAGHMVKGSVARKTVQTGQGESTYQDGYRSEPNPDYLQAEEDLRSSIKNLDRARKRLAEAEARLARYDHIDPTDSRAVARRDQARADVAEARQRLVNAATDVGAAEALLAATAKERVVPNIVAHTYPIETVTWTAAITCAMKVVDTATGEVLMTQQVEGEHTFADQMIAAEPSKNVTGDPLELPDEALLMSGAADALMSKLKEALSSAYDKHGHRFLVQMRQAEASGNTDQALDSAVRYIFAYPKGADQTARMRDYLHQYLGQENALLDIRGLLRTHCQVLR